MAVKTEAQLETERDTFTDSGANTASKFRTFMTNIIDTMFNGDPASTNINGLTTNSSIDATADLIPYYDASVAANRKVTFDNFSKRLANVGASKQIYNDAENDLGDSGASLGIDWTDKNFHKTTLTGACTITFDTDPNGPTTMVLKLVQDATGSRTITWPASMLWQSGTAPTLSTAANSVDLISIYFDGTNYYGSAGLDFQ